MNENETRTFQLMYKLTEQIKALEIMKSTDEEIKEMQKTCDLIIWSTEDKTARKTAQAIKASGDFIIKTRNVDSNKARQKNMKKALSKIQTGEVQMDKYINRLQKEVN